MPNLPASSAPAAYITSVAEFLPGPPVDNLAMAARLGLSADWINHFIGNHARHFSVDLETGLAKFSLAEMAERAARDALAEANLGPEGVEFIVMATATPDHLMPATVNVVADQLGINLVPTYQLQSGCAGAVQAIDLATLLLTSGRHRVGLILAGDITCKHLALDQDFAGMPADQLVNAVLFGDAATAAVVSTTPSDRSLAVRAVLNELAGLGRAAGQTVGWFGLAAHPDASVAFSEDYKAIERWVPVMAAEIVSRLLDEADWAVEDVNYLLPPQLSGRMTARIVERLAIVAATSISCVDSTGNTGNALPFLQMRRLMDRCAPGDRALVVAVESSKWIKSGLALERM